MEAECFASWSTERKTESQDSVLLPEVSKIVSLCFSEDSNAASPGIACSMLSVIFLMVSQAFISVIREWKNAKPSRSTRNLGPDKSRFEVDRSACRLLFIDSRLKVCTKRYSLKCDLHR